MAIPIRRKPGENGGGNFLKSNIMLMVYTFLLCFFVSRRGGPHHKDDDILLSKEAPKTELQLLRQDMEQHKGITRATNLQLRLGEISDLGDLRTRGTPQNHAFSWLVDDDDANLGIDSPNLFQRYILSLLWFSLGGKMWKHSDIFLSPKKHECDWYETFGNQGRMGVLECNEDLEITNLFLVENELVGSLPSEIHHLSKLTNLDLHRNKLSENIPEQLGYLTTLEYLSIAKNNFSGQIPKTLGGIDTLEQLLVNDNQLTGEIPESICQLRKTGAFYNLWSDCTSQMKCDCCSVCCEAGKCAPVAKKATANETEATTDNNDADEPAASIKRRLR